MTNEDDRLREALAVAICSTFDMTGHDHDTFLQPDHCDEGLRDADLMLPRVRAALRSGAEVAAAPGLDVDALADEVRYAGGNGTSDYWRGFNDGIDRLAARLTAKP